MNNKDVVAKIAAGIKKEKFASFSRSTIQAEPPPATSLFIVLTRFKNRNAAFHRNGQIVKFEKSKKAGYTLMDNDMDYQYDKLKTGIAAQWGQ